MSEIKSQLRLIREGAFEYNLADRLFENGVTELTFTEADESIGSYSYDFITEADDSVALAQKIKSFFVWIGQKISGFFKGLISKIFNHTKTKTNYIMKNADAIRKYNGDGSVNMLADMENPHINWDEIDGIMMSKDVADKIIAKGDVTSKEGHNATREELDKLVTDQLHDYLSTVFTNAPKHNTNVEDIVKPVFGEKKTVKIKSIDRNKLMARLNQMNDCDKTLAKSYKQMTDIVNSLKISIAKKTKDQVGVDLAATTKLVQGVLKSIQIMIKVIMFGFNNAYSTCSAIIKAK